MRVLHVIPSIAAQSGGTTTAVIALCDALNRQPGVTAELVATCEPGESRSGPTAPNVTKMHLFHAVGGVRSKRSAEMFRWLMDRAGEFDVIHSHSVWNLPVGQARKAAVRHNRPFVYSPHGMLSDYTWTRNWSLKLAYWWAVERKNVSAATAFLCTSTGEAAEVRRLRAAAGQVHIIPNGVEAAAWSHPVAADELRRRCGSQADGLPIILFLSRLHPKKGLTDFLLPALARMKSAAFLAVVGGADHHAPGYEQSVRDTVRRLNLETRVALLGTAGADERWAMFDGADLFVLPSRSENFGIVVAEAMARGCPVVVSREVQSCEHVTSAAAGAVVPLDVQSVADALDHLLTDSERRTAAGRNGRVYARREFDWDGIAGRVADLYRQLHRGVA